MDDLTTTLWGLFVSAFVSSTVLPGGSELLLIYLAQQQVHSSVSLLAVATLGNTLGGLTTWGIGRWCAKKYPLERLLSGKYQQAISRMHRWGSPALLLSWLPVIGDPICFASGWLRMSLLQSIIYILLGKLLRYLAILGFIDWLL